MSRIPEPTVADLDLQTDTLISKFGGNQHFDAIRGKCGEKLLTITDTIMRNADGAQKAPSSSVEDLKDFFNSVAIIRNKIAQLERDGFHLAAHEARKALEQPGYRMLGEVEPFEKTVPMTLLMCNSKLTLQILAQKYSQNNHLCKLEEVPPEIHVPPYQASRGVAYYVDIIRSLSQINYKLFEKLKDRPAKHIHHRDLNHSVLLPNLPQEQRTKISYSLACVCYAPKHVILRKFTKAEQKQLALWEFNLPQKYAGGEEQDIYFGIHLKAEHRYWQKMRTPFCSTNIAHGYGAIAYPGEAYHCFDEKSKRFTDTRILLY